MTLVRNGRSIAYTNDTGSHGVLDASTRAKVQAGCNFVNAEATRLRHQLIAIGIASVLSAILLGIFAGAALVAIVIASGIFVLFFTRAKNELASSYTNTAAKRIVAALGSELAFRSASSLTQQQFAAMDLFGARCVRWTSRNEIGGRRRGVKYSVHEVEAGGTDRRSVVFRGTIIKVDCHAGFPGHTVILPDRDGQGAGDASGGGGGRKKDLVMVKNPSFERFFSVYSTDYYEAKQLVTPKLMSLVMDARTKLDADLRVCFVQKSIFITIARDSQRPLPKVFGPPLTPDLAVGDLPRMVLLAEQVAEVFAA